MFRKYDFKCTKEFLESIKFSIFAIRIAGAGGEMVDALVSGASGVKPV